VDAGAAPRLDACRCFVPVLPSRRQKADCSGSAGPRAPQHHHHHNSHLGPHVPARGMISHAQTRQTAPSRPAVLDKDAPFSTRRLAGEWRLLFRRGSDEQITEDFVTWHWDSLHAELQMPRVHPTISLHTRITSAEAKQKMGNQHALPRAEMSVDKSS